MHRTLPDIPFRPIALAELPQYSPWPARLLGLTPFQVSEKTHREVMREFGTDKWGAILSRVEASDELASLDVVEAWEFGDAEEVLCSFGDDVGFCPHIRARQFVVDRLASTLETYYPASGLVELGAGYGQKILSLAQRSPFAGSSLIGGELTTSGRDVMRLLAKRLDVQLQVVDVDLSLPRITSDAIPADAVIFTSYAAHYVPEYTRALVVGLMQLRPRVIVHFEPIYDHYRMDSLLGLMRRRYVEVNGYNRNLLATIRAMADEGQIEIVEEVPVVFGLNPLLPFSVLAWRPHVVS